MMLFVGDDWAEDHHDIAIIDGAGRLLARRRLPEGVVGIEKFHHAVADHVPEDGQAGQVLVAIETDRGPWVQALLAAGYTVYAINPLQAAPLPGTARHLGCQVRQGRRPRAGRDPAHRRRSSPPDHR